MPDAVIIGSGPNGLVAANVLAGHGWSVQVLEAEPEPGGAVRSGELTLPGFIHDRFSSFYPLAAASPAIKALHLEDHGLRWRRHPLPVAHPGRDGSVAYIAPHLDDTAACLDGFADGDGDAWRRLMTLWDDVGEDIIAALFTPFPQVRPALRMVRQLGFRGLTNLARLGVLPIRRLADEQFRGEGAGRLLAGNALHGDFSPEQPGSAMFGWVLSSLAQTVGYPIPEGGSGELTRALVRRLESLSGTIACDARVTAIEVRRGRAVAVRTDAGQVVTARRAILADVGAPQLYSTLLAHEHVPAPLRRALEHFEYGNSTFKVDFALDGAIPWLHPDTGRAGTVHITPGLDALTREATEIALRRIPAEPFLVTGQYAQADPTRMPHGKEVFWAYTHVPQRPAGDAGQDGLTGTWNERERERFADRLTNQVEAMAPGFRELILARHITAPRDFEAMNANLVGGAINGGTAQLHQELIFRPVPGLGRNETPIAGLYLASASAYPSGGVHGACGANAARAALRQRGVLAYASARVTARLTGSPDSS